MKIIFAGTPHFAATSLAALKAAGHDILLVLTQPDRPAGRGLKIVESETAQLAGRLGLRVEKPRTLQDEITQVMLREIDADLMVVAAYGLLLPPVILAIPRLGCINIHGSLLPRWRGAAPIQRAIEAGDHETGITIMQMDAGLDTGDILLERRIAIAAGVETSASLFAKLAVLGGASIVEALASLPAFKPQPQSSRQFIDTSYAKKILKSEARINWAEAATVLERRIRAFDPFPGTETRYRDETIKIWQASVVPDGVKDAVKPIPGTIIDMTANLLIVQCGQDALALNMVQKAGGKRIPIADFLRGLASRKTATNDTPTIADVAMKIGNVFR